VGNWEDRAVALQGTHLGIHVVVAHSSHIKEVHAAYTAVVAEPPERNIRKAYTRKVDDGERIIGRVIR
jgi:hypothetical protein